MEIKGKFKIASLTLIAIIISVLILYYFNTSFLKEIVKSKKYLSDSIYSLKVNNDKNLLIIASESGRIDIYNTKSKFILPKSIQAHAHRITEVTISKDGSILTTGSDVEGITKVWSNYSLKLIHSFNNVYGPTFIMPDNNTIFVAKDSSFKIYDVKRAKIISENSAKGVINYFNVSNDQNYLAIGSTGIVEIWKIIKTENGILIEFVNSVNLNQPDDWIINMQFSEDNLNLLTISRFGKIEFLNIPQLNRQKNYQSLIHHVTSSLIIGEQFESIILFGTRTISGLEGDGQVEQIFPSSGATRMLWWGLSNFPKADYFPTDQKMLVSNSHKLYLLTYYNYKR